MSLPDPELHEEADREEDSNGRVDAHRQVAQVPADQWGDYVVESSSWKAAVEEVEGQGNDEAEWQSENNPGVGSAYAEHEFGQSAKRNGLLCIS